MSMIEVNNVSMRFNMAKEKHESLKGPEGWKGLQSTLTNKQ